MLSDFRKRFEWNGTTVELPQIRTPAFNMPGPNRRPTLTPIAFSEPKRHSFVTAEAWVEDGQARPAGTMQTASFVKPFYMPRYISAASFKLLADQPRSRLFIEENGAWIPVSNDHIIDTEDESKLFMLGKVFIIS